MNQSTAETILLVDDQPEVSRIAEDMLEDLGYRVLTAHSASEALDVMAANDNIDLLITDIVMPGSMNGADLALKAREEAGLRSILVTGYADRAIPSDQFERFDVLLKPYRLDELEERVRAALAKDMAESR